MGMRGKREAGGREEAGLPQGTEKEELRVTGFPCRSMGMTREDESGRSMVETLGVLAIMGVLAIGGIVGYQYAMDKYNANEILNEVRKRAVVVSSQMTADQAVRLDEFPDRIQEHYPVLLKTNYQNNPDFFTIAVQEIPAGVCRHLLSEEPQMSVRLLLNSAVVTADTNCPTGTSEVGFVFERTLRQGEPTKGCAPACGDGQVCNDGRCVCGTGNQYCGGRFCCRPGYKCAGYGDWRCLPKCTSDTECAIGERCSIGGTCGDDTIHLKTGTKGHAYGEYRNYAVCKG